MQTILQIYKNLTVAQTMLPTSTGYTWWAAYEASPGAFDREFTRMFANYTYDDIFGDDADDIYNDWILDVKALFNKNAKKYAEFYRIHTVSDTDMPLAYNYDMTETMDRDTTDANTVKAGQRTDVNNFAQGTQINDNVDKVTGWNSGSENVSTSNKSGTGSRNDITQFTKGAEEQTERGTGTEDYTLTRKGNIGVQTAADIARIFLNFWDDPRTNLYQVIFMDICRELLRIE